MLIYNAVLVSPWAFNLCVLPHALPLYTLHFGAEGPHNWNRSEDRVVDDTR